MWFGYKKEVAFFNSLIYVEGHKEVFIIMLLIRSHNLNDETLQAPHPIFLTGVLSFEVPA